jgi:hypothetical protein
VERIADSPHPVSRVLADMRVMPFIHGMYGIVILRGAAVALDRCDGSGLLGCNCALSCYRNLPQRDGHHEMADVVDR